MIKILIKIYNIKLNTSFEKNKFQKDKKEKLTEL